MNQATSIPIIIQNCSDSFTILTYLDPIQLSFPLRILASHAFPQVPRVGRFSVMLRDFPAAGEFSAAYSASHADVLMISDVYICNFPSQLPSVSTFQYLSYLSGLIND